MWHSFQKILPKAAGKYSFAKTLDAIKVCQEYRSIAEQILPENALESTFPKSYKNNKLTIGVLNSSWAQVVQMNKHRIHQSLKDKFGEKKVSDIRIEIAEEHPSKQH